MGDTENNKESGGDQEFDITLMILELNEGAFTIENSKDRAEIEGELKKLEDGLVRLKDYISKNALESQFGQDIQNVENELSLGKEKLITLLKEQEPRAKQENAETVQVADPASSESPADITTEGVAKRPGGAASPASWGDVFTAVSSAGANLVKGAGAVLNTAAQQARSSIEQAVSSVSDSGKPEKNTPEVAPEKQSSRDIDSADFDLGLVIDYLQDRYNKIMGESDPVLIQKMLEDWKRNFQRFNGAYNESPVKDNYTQKYGKLVKLKNNLQEHFHASSLLREIHNLKREGDGNLELYNPVKLNVAADQWTRQYKALDEKYEKMLEDGLIDHDANLPISDSFRELDEISQKMLEARKKVNVEPIERVERMLRAGPRQDEFLVEFQQIKDDIQMEGGELSQDHLDKLNSLRARIGKAHSDNLLNEIEGVMKDFPVIEDFNNTLASLVQGHLMDLQGDIVGYHRSRGKSVDTQKLSTLFDATFRKLESLFEKRNEEFSQGLFDDLMKLKGMMLYGDIKDSINYINKMYDSLMEPLESSEKEPVFEEIQARKFQDIKKEVRGVEKKGAAIDEKFVNRLVGFRDYIILYNIQKLKSEIGKVLDMQLIHGDHYDEFENALDAQGDLKQQLSQLKELRDSVYKEARVEWSSEIERLMAEPSVKEKFAARYEELKSDASDSIDFCSKLVGLRDDIRKYQADKLMSSIRGMLNIEMPDMVGDTELREIISRFERINEIYEDAKKLSTRESFAELFSESNISILRDLESDLRKKIGVAKASESEIFSSVEMELNDADRLLSNGIRDENYPQYRRELADFKKEFEKLKNGDRSADQINELSSLIRGFNQDIMSEHKKYLEERIKSYINKIGSTTKVNDLKSKLAYLQKESNEKGISVSIIDRLFELNRFSQEQLFEEKANEIRKALDFQKIIEGKPRKIILERLEKIEGKFNEGAEFSASDFKELSMRLAALLDVTTLIVSMEKMMASGIQASVRNDKGKSVNINNEIAALRTRVVEDLQNDRSLQDCISDANNLKERIVSAQSKTIIDQIKKMKKFDVNITPEKAHEIMVLLTKVEERLKNESAGDNLQMLLDMQKELQVKKASPAQWASRSQEKASGAEPAKKNSIIQRIFGRKKSEPSEGQGLDSKSGKGPTQSSK